MGASAGLGGVSAEGWAVVAPADSLQWRTVYGSAVHRFDAILHRTREAAEVSPLGARLAAGDIAGSIEFVRAIPHGGVSSGWAFEPAVPA